MKMLELNFEERNELNNAHALLDGYETEKQKRVPYKWGAERRAISKNMSLLIQSLQEVAKVRSQIFEEVWPGKAASPKGDVEGEEKFALEEKKLFAHKEKFDLEELSDSILFGEQEFPLAALATLEKYKLIKK